ncbi:hypothetical protein [Pusillimonas noertemannii]
MSADQRVKEVYLGEAAHDE